MSAETMPGWNISKGKGYSVVKVNSVPEPA